MLPATIAADIKRQVLHYLEATFEFRDPDVQEALNRFLLDPQKGLFKGPWLQLRRPYRQADAPWTNPFGCAVPFHPFKHQDLSWKRLLSDGQKPQHTLVTTGTGSGKSECFFYPILDHCQRMNQARQAGIKAIILYPMNALAADQVGRLAKIIHQDDRLNSKGARVRVGLYTGRFDPANPGAGAEAGATKRMGPNHGITSRDELLANPPDILLTNYKMLDYLLMRPSDQGLWQHNLPGVLQYLVLDELHTYDGAQGADVACLLRRLKERLGCQQGELCCVGTSATIESGPAPGMAQADPDSRLNEGGETYQVHAADAAQSGEDRLANFAGRLFEEDPQHFRVIGEDRESVAEVVPTVEITADTLPDPAACVPLPEEDAPSYAHRQAGLWGAPVSAGSLPASTPLPGSTPSPKSNPPPGDAWRVAVGLWLRRHDLFKILLELVAEAEAKQEDPLLWLDLLQRLRSRDWRFKELTTFDSAHHVLCSFLALIAQARRAIVLRDGGQILVPVVPTQMQLWLRELRRLGRVVSDADHPAFAWLDEPIPSRRQLPAFHCSECGESGWMALHDHEADSALHAAGVNGIRLLDDPTKIYQAWFAHQGKRSPRIVIFSPWREDEYQENQQRQTTATFIDWYCHPESLVLRQDRGRCPDTEKNDGFRVRISAEVTDGVRRDKDGHLVGEQCCPHCGSDNGLFFIGSQSATLCSVAIDEMFGSPLNEDPKLLAFTDSVQDASHRAGFFSARTFNFTFRTALRQVIGVGGDDGVPLPEVADRMLQYWAEPGIGRPGTMKQAMATLLPPDLTDYKDWRDFRDKSSDPEPSRRLYEALCKRLQWESISEFGVMQAHGRSLERMGACTLAWDASIIGATIDALRERCEGISTSLTTVDPRHWQRWLFGLLWRYRIKGALHHDYLHDWARINLWGKRRRRGDAADPGRETYPSYGHFVPRLLTTHFDKRHEHLTATSRGGPAPWPIIWTRRALDNSMLDEATISDLLRLLLQVGTTTALFRRLHIDGEKSWYSINDGAARLQANCTQLLWGRADKPVVRPADEAALWLDGPSLDYHAPDKTYHVPDKPWTDRQVYYQLRYQKGSLRRVVATEHTGLLTTQEREQTEADFGKDRKARFADDPNVLTCTSTLEMGIDIGDLSSTMLCSVPPTTASYLQRIGRAGRSTGTALILSVVNQRPHDLFFYARPRELLKGRVQPPGCWLDASAVLVRQYLGYCIDTAVRDGILTVLPGSAKDLAEDMDIPGGHMPRLFDWIAAQEPLLLKGFLGRYTPAQVGEAARMRFALEAETSRLREQTHLACKQFVIERRDITNAQKRLQETLKQLGPDEDQSRREIDQELRILRGRLTSLGRVRSLELLTEHGLLPNYAFPERGVKFHGSIYNRFRNDGDEIRPTELVRGAGAALKELAPGNHFYTHSRRFEIQQISIGSEDLPIVEEWAICGHCGHMRKTDELRRPDANPACPQCGHDGDTRSQTDLGQQRKFLEYSRSQAMSFMEQYDSLSADRSDERQRSYYQVLRSFDHTQEQASGAVVHEAGPFGIEYRSNLIVREVNTGYGDQQATLEFGQDQKAPELGFQVCKHCGVVAAPGMDLSKVRHRRSCQAWRTWQADQAKGKESNPYKWESLYLYRELKSEAIRLLLPMIDDEDLATIQACLILGLRLRFEGDPAHLLVAPQILPDSEGACPRHYLVLMDAVPGGTGYLKALFEERDTSGRQGEGLITVLRLALNALESCTCRRLVGNDDDPDGCYRCIRTYHQQYDAEHISRERGISILRNLLDFAAHRVPTKELDSVKTEALFGSVLEKRLVERLKAYVLSQHGSWDEALVGGGKGFRFQLPKAVHAWRLELQPYLGEAQGVGISSNPDFMLRCDDPKVKPVAIFADGFEFHCLPPHNQIRVDIAKRRSIMESQQYRVWSLSWDDLQDDAASLPMVTQGKLASLVEQYASAARARGLPIPDAQRALSNAFNQLLAFIESPTDVGWAHIAQFTAFRPLNTLAEKGTLSGTSLMTAAETWAAGGGFVRPDEDAGDWVAEDRFVLAKGDCLMAIPMADLLANRPAEVRVFLRLDDEDSVVTASSFRERWRRFHAMSNVFQFAPLFRIWAVSEGVDASKPVLPFVTGSDQLDPQWRSIVEDVAGPAKPWLCELARLDIPVPEVEFYPDGFADEICAECAWLLPNQAGVVLLLGDQAAFAARWQQAGWTVVVDDDVHAKGSRWLADTILATLKGA